MTYNTPELLLVGAAQNLVFGAIDFKSDSQGTNWDDLAQTAYAHIAVVEDSGSW